LRLAHPLWLLGEEDEADRQRDRTLAAASESTHAYSRSVAEVWAAILALDRGDVARFRGHVHALESTTPEDAAAQIRLPMRFFEGQLDVLEGRTAEGLARLREVREQVVRGAPAPGVPGLATRFLLGGYALAGEADAGLALADEALSMGRGAQLWEAEVRRLRAVFLAALGSPAAEVEEELGRALAVASRQHARAFEERIRRTPTTGCAEPERAL
jgi:hypothetical protein